MRLRASLIAILCLCAGSARGQLINSYRFGAAAGPTYLINQNLEGTGYDNSETWTETLTGSSTINEDNTTNVMEGSQDLLLTRGTGNCFTVSPTFTTSTEIWIYFTFRASSTVNEVFLVIKDSGGTTHGQLAIRNSSPVGGLRIYNNDALTNFQNTANGMSANTNYHIWAHWNFATGAADCEWETTDTKVGSGGNFASLTGGDTTGAAGKIQFQITTNSEVKTIDKIRVDDAAIGSSPQ